MSRECSATSLGMPGISEGLHAKMSALARRKSMSTSSYFGSRVELTLNALALGGSRVEGHFLGLFRGLEVAGVLGGGVEVLVDHLLQGGHQRFIQRQRFHVLYALDVAVERVLDG
jgi:hypothetical protein